MCQIAGVCAVAMPMLAEQCCPPFVLFETVAGHSGAVQVTLPSSDICAVTVCTKLAFPKAHVIVPLSPSPYTDAELSDHIAISGSRIECISAE